MSGIIENIKNIIYVFSLGLNKTNSFFKLERYETEKRNMLIGTVKSREQFEINLKHNFYYMPLSYVFDINSCYDYIAVYQSAKNFGQDSGIEYFGEIQDMKLVQRDEITEIPRASKEKYLRFAVKWQKRETKICPDCAIRNFHETSYEIFKNAKNVSELFIRSYEEYKLWEFFKNNFSDAKIFICQNGIYKIKAGIVEIKFNSYSVTALENDKQLFKVSRYNLRKNLSLVIEKLTDIKKEKNTVENK